MKHLNYKDDLYLIGKRIANSRKLAGFTQEQLAHSIGFATKHISEIERGICGLSVSALMLIAKTLNVSTDYILFGVGTKISPIETKIQKLLPKQKNYMDNLMEMFVDCCLDDECFPIPIKSNNENTN